MAQAFNFFFLQQNPNTPPLVEASSRLLEFLAIAFDAPSLITAGKTSLWNA
jgi:hypothetical protein